MVDVMVSQTIPNIRQRAVPQALFIAAVFAPEVHLLSANVKDLVATTLNSVVVPEVANRTQIVRRSSLMFWVTVFL